MYDTPEAQDDSPFWAAAAEGRLAFQRCSDCAYLRWPAAGVCPECLSRTFAWEDVDPRGTVWSQVVYHRAYGAALKERVPYSVALVELDCGVRLLSTLVDVPAGVDAVGAAVVGEFGAVGPTPAVPVFRLA